MAANKITKRISNKLALVNLRADVMNKTCC